ncbi:MAG: cyanophycin synthetase [Patescibacteria group bacterium]
MAPKVGARVVLEPEWGIAAQIVYKNGVTRSLRYLSLDLNHIASADIAKDKGYAKFFIKKLGYPVADGVTVLKDSWAKAIKSKKNILYAIRYAARAGYPLIVKPNSLSQGFGVALVSNNKELRQALSQIFKEDKIAILEKYLPGKDYRIVVLDSDVISAYERIALSVVGDGKHSILSLLKTKQNNFIKSGRDTRINFADARMKLKLQKQSLTWKSIIPKGKKIYLLDNANLSTGGDSVDVTNTIHSGFRKIAINLTREMGLRISGVDIMVTRGNITEDPKKCKYYIIEINAAPGLDHYVTTGAKQKKIVEAMYLKVLKALGKKD